MMKILIFFFTITFSVCFASQAKADCHPSQIKFDNTLRTLNLLQDPDHYSKRSIDEDSLCEMLRIFKRIIPKSTINSIPIDYIVDWDNGNPNAIADYNIKEKAYSVVINGGLLSAKSISELSLPAVICHELGHIVGGTPKSRLRFGGKDIINVSEGLSDYYATHICLKKYYKEMSHYINDEKLKRVDDICSSSIDKNECLFLLNSSFEAQFAITHINGHAGVNFEIPSSRIVNQTIQGFFLYPDPQCRFDSMVAGYFCNNNTNLPCGFSKKGIFKSLGDPHAHPPRCFFKD